MIPAHLIQQLRNIYVHEIIRALERDGLSTVGREDLEGSIGVRGEAAP